MIDSGYNEYFQSVIYFEGEGEGEGGHKSSLAESELSGLQYNSPSM